MKISELIKQRSLENFTLHEEYLNNQMVNVLKTIGFNRNYVKAEGPYLFDDQDHRYLDLLSGFGVFALGRNHPKVIQNWRPFNVRDKQPWLAVGGGGGNGPVHIHREVLKVSGGAT